MSLAEVVRPNGSGNTPEFERTPPQDIPAEQSVLGGMLLSKEAIADVVEVLRPTDFYRPTHQLVYDAILDLYGRGEPVDAVTVSAELTRLGTIAKVGGGPYLHTLISAVPTAANAGYYASIVRERAILRRLVEAGTRIVQLGYGIAAAGGDVDDAVDRAQAAVYDVSERRTTEDYQVLEHLLQPALDEIESIGNRGGAMAGVPTGFRDLDELTNGLHPGQLIIIAARPAIGKALALDTPLPTPTGWTTMGEVRVGDLLLGSDGKPTRVLAATDVLRNRACYEVGFSDGTVIVADGQHRWLTDDRASRKSAQAAVVRYHRYRNRRTFAAVRTTEQIAASLRCDVADRRLNHSVRNTAALELPDQFLPVPPYSLGLWLGNGHSAAARITTADPEVVLYVEAEGLRLVAGSGLAYSLRLPARPAVKERSCASCRDCNRPSSGLAQCQACRDDHGTVKALLRGLGVLRHKHIPPLYLRASVQQRRALLAGLLDSDGTVMPTGLVQLVVTTRRLAEDFRELVVGLGYRCSTTSRRVAGRSEESSIAHAITFSTADDVFRLSRKQLMHKRRRRARAVGHRFITDVRPVRSVPVRCVEVDNSEHLYLAGRSMIPTHNSTLGLDFARSAAIAHNLPAVIFSLEMSRSEITMRLLSAEARVPLHHMRTGRMTDDDWARLARRIGEVADKPLYIDDSPNLTMMEIRAKARRLKQRHDLRLVVVDYMQLMQSTRRVETRQQEVSEISRSLKLLAKELEIPVIGISQLNRGPEQRTDKKPMLSDLRESGCLTADTMLLRADTGAPVSFGALLDRGHDGVLVWSVDENHRLTPGLVTAVFPAGVKQAYRLRLASGREVSASGNHRFLQPTGWRPLDDLCVGDRVAVPRHLPPPVGMGLGWSEQRLGLLAHLIGDGFSLGSQPVHYTSHDEANLAFVEEAAAAEFGISARRVRLANGWHSYLPAPSKCTHGRGNPLHEWFRTLGIEDLRSGENRLPDVMHSASDGELATFLRHLWATDGSVPEPPAIAGGIPRPCYSSTSRLLVDGVALLLARFGIVGRIHHVPKRGYAGCYNLTIAGGPCTRLFSQLIGVDGHRGGRACRLLAGTEGREPNTNVDTLPLEVWDPGSSDLFWDSIVAIEPLGAQPVYDATVKGTHNFIANGIVAHNSIEQDSDAVILLYREDAFERESPRAGEADLILAKHRNGPTGTVTVAFQGHYSRFVDMSPG